MGGARIEIEVEGVKHSLYFGMTATEIISTKSVKMALDGEVSDMRAFAYIVYGGMCNAADLADVTRPTYPDCYLIAESIHSDKNKVDLICNSWSSSKPGKEALEMIDSAVNKKKE